MLRRMYDWTLALAAHPQAVFWLAVVAFADSSVFPVTPLVMMLPMAFAAPRRALHLATVATLASVAGGLLGYGIGALAYETVGRQIVALYRLEDEMQIFQQTFADYGGWIVVIGGIMPLPYKIFTISAGVAGLDLVIFILGSLLSRGVRFYAAGLLIYFFGEKVRPIIERRLGLWVGAGVAAVLVLILGAKLAAG